MTPFQAKPFQITQGDRFTLDLTAKGWLIISALDGNNASLQRIRLLWDGGGELPLIPGSGFQLQRDARLIGLAVDAGTVLPVTVELGWGESIPTTPPLFTGTVTITPPLDVNIVNQPVAIDGGNPTPVVITLDATALPVPVTNPADPALLRVLAYGAGSPGMNIMPVEQDAVYNGYLFVPSGMIDRVNTGAAVPLEASRQPWAGVPANTAQVQSVVAPIRDYGANFSIPGATSSLVCLEMRVIRFDAVPGSQALILSHNGTNHPIPWLDPTTGLVDYSGVIPITATSGYILCQGCKQIDFASGGTDWDVSLYADSLPWSGAEPVLPIQTALFNTTSAAGAVNNIIGTPGAGFKIRVLGYAQGANGAVNVRWQGTGGGRLWADRYATTSFAEQAPEGRWLFEAPANEGLDLFTDVATAFGLAVNYVVVPA